MDNYLVEKIAKFYRVCLFGSNESDVCKAAADRAYRDLCRTIKFKDKDNKDKNNKKKDKVNKSKISKENKFINFVIVKKNILFSIYNRSTKTFIIRLYN